MNITNGIIKFLLFIEHSIPSMKKDNGTIPTNPIINNPFKLKTLPKINTINIVIIGMKFPNLYFFILYTLLFNPSTETLLRTLLYWYVLDSKLFIKVYGYKNEIFG